MTRSSNNELVEPYDEPEQVLHSMRKLFKTTRFDHSNSREFELFYKHEGQFEEEITKTMTEPTMEEYMTKTREDYGSGVSRPKFDKDVKFELKGQFLKELHDHTFSESKNKDENEHIESILEIVDLFTTPDVTMDQLMLRVFPITLTGATSRCYGMNLLVQLLLGIFLREIFSANTVHLLVLLKRWRKSITFSKSQMKLFTRLGNDSRNFY
ncbi:hypothetical protein Tco_0734297 [Tanacetum coccineum]